MKRVKTVIHVSSQQEYDEVVQFFKKNGKTPFYAGAETDENIYNIYSSDSCIKISKNKILFGSLIHYNNNDEFNVIDFNEFDKSREISKFEGVERVKTETNKKMLADLVYSHCDDEEFDREELLHFSALVLPGLISKLTKEESKSVSKIKETASLSIIYAKECLSQISKLTGK